MLRGQVRTREMWITRSLRGAHEAVLISRRLGYRCDQTNGTNTVLQALVTAIAIPASPAPDCLLVGAARSIGAAFGLADFIY